MSGATGANSLHLHAWSAWRTFDVKHFVDPDTGKRWVEFLQTRNCRKCGEIRSRREKS